jgi:DNA-binding NarL/FixJ family response regulator
VITDGGKVRIDLPNQPHTPIEAQDPAEIGVVIVDDQAPFRSVVRTLVSMIRGWRVLGEAETGEDGVSQVDELAPRLVLMDINLPGINGIEATRRIMAGHPETAVVLLSTYAAEDLPADAQSCGAAGYIRKDDLTPKLLKNLLAA